MKHTQISIRAFLQKERKLFWIVLAYELDLFWYRSRVVHKFKEIRSKSSTVVTQTHNKYK